MSKRLKKQLRNQQGGILLTVLGIFGVIGILGYLISGFLAQSHRRSFDEEILMEAEILAEELIETAKYLILYEPIIFLDQPLNHSGTRAEQWKRLVSMGWGSVSSETMDLARACGGFDGKGRQLGQYTIDGSPVFCPAYLRSHLFNNNMLEQMVLEPMVTKGVIKRLGNGRSGVYDIPISFFNKSTGTDGLSTRGQGLFDLNMGQKIIRMKDKLEKAEVNIRILTSSAGFDSLGSERMIEISSVVEVNGAGVATTRKAKKEFLVHPATPKDFALFMMYPETSKGTRTTSFKEAVVLPAGSEVQGRVFFNGNMDVEFDRLPVFQEVVVLTGDFIPTLTPATRAKLRSKFKKGVITRFAAARYLTTGKCSAQDPKAHFVNNAQLACKTETGGEFSMNEYLNKFAATCLAQDMVYEDGNYKPRNGYAGTGSEKSCSGSGVISGTYSRLEIKGNYGLVASPVRKVKVLSTVKNLYGTIFGGHLTAEGPLKIKSFANLSWEEIKGQPGIGGNEATFNSLNTSFQTSYEGITAILVNLPIVYSGEAQ